MGMGEPLHNYDSTMKALRILADANGLSVSPRRDDAVDRRRRARASNGWRASRSCRTWRSRCTRRPTSSASVLVPINRKYRLAEILEACRRFPLKRRSRITFEYVLLRRRQRHAGRRAATGEAAATASKAKVNLHAAERSRRPSRSTRPSDDRGESLRPDPGRPRVTRLGAQEPRTRHPRRVRAVDRGRAAPVAGSAAGGGHDGE